MQGEGKNSVPGARLAASRTRPMLVIPTARDELRGREHLGIGEAQCGVRRVDSRTKHDKPPPVGGSPPPFSAPEPASAPQKPPRYPQHSPNTAILALPLSSP